MLKPFQTAYQVIETTFFTTGVKTGMENLIPVYSIPTQFHILYGPKGRHRKIKLATVWTLSQPQTP